jgi:hypothetical protein
MGGMWIKILSAVMMAAWIIYLWPRAKYWLSNSPAPKEGDWTAAMLPLGAVVLFVILLIMMVR